MKIKGLEGMTIDELNDELAKGAKFVYFTWSISILILSFKEPTEDCYFVKHNESAIKYGWPYFLLSFVLGWWGIPWGPIYTVQSIINAFKGVDVTDKVIESLNNEN